MSTSEIPQQPARLTVLQAAGKRLTKVYETDNKGGVVKRGYDQAARFTSRSVEVESVDALDDLLRRQQRHPNACVIIAAPGKWHLGEGRTVQRRLYAAVELVDDQGQFQKAARKGTAAVRQQREIEAGRVRLATVLPHFEEQPTRILLLDFDGVDAPAGVEWREDLAWTAAYLRMRLPSEFHACRCVYYATSSAADLTKPDLGGPAIRMRLGFVLDRGVSFAQAKRWLAGVDGLDQSTLQPAQLIYTAAPIFRGGLTDPMPERLGVLDGERELVPVPEIPIEQRFERRAFAGLGPVRSAEGLGLVRPHPKLDATLERLAMDGGAAGTVRSGLLRCTYAYIADAGRDHVDVDALAEFLAEVGEQYRSPAEVAGYALEGLIRWCLERSPDEPPPRPHYPGGGLPRAEASAQLGQEMAAAVGAAVAWRATVSVASEGQTDVNPQPPVVGIKAGAGAGKTGAALEQIAAIPGVEQMNVEIYVPDHRLAEEMAARAREAAPSLRVLVIRGRGATDLDGGPMCQKSELAEEVATSGLDVMGHLCRRKPKGGGDEQFCEFYGRCAYIAQFQDSSPAIRIMPHAAMFVRRNKALPKPDLIVIDESFWHDATAHRRLALDRLTEVGRWQVRPRQAGKRAGNASPEEIARDDFDRVKARKEAADRRQDAEAFAHWVRAALEDGRDPRTVVTAEEAEMVAAVEWGSRGGPSIKPGMSYQAQWRVWNSWQRDECAKTGRFWNLLAAEHGHRNRPMQRIVLERDAATKDGDRRHLLHLHYRRELHLAKAPVILLDADLDPIIAGKFFPAVRVVEIPVRQQARVIQIVDKTVAMSWLLGGRNGDQERADRRLAELQRFAGGVFADGGGLFVSYKDALEPGRVLLPDGVDAIHLGDLRGRDGYKHHNVAVVAGRLEPGAGALEDLARAMFGDEPEPIATVPAGEHGGTRYPQAQRRYRMAGGAAGQAVAVSVHPDPRAQALLEQIRERELEQAVARLRLVHRDRPATVYVLTSVPLNLEVTMLTTWAALCRDRDAEACARWGGLWLLSSGERAKAAPDLFVSAAGDRMQRHRKGVTESSNKDSRGDRYTFPDYPAWGRGLARDACTLVAYRYPGQRGSAHQALVPGEVWCADTCRAYLEDVLGPVGSVTILRTMHRAPIADAGEPEPLAVPIDVLAPAHVLDVSEAWSFSGIEAQRWTLATGQAVLVPKPWWRCQLTLRSPEHPTAFARAAPE